MSKDCHDKLFIVLSLINVIKERFQMITENLCMYEHMVTFKSRSKLKQYNPQNPKKWDDN